MAKNNIACIIKMLTMYQVYKVSNADIHASHIIYGLSSRFDKHINCDQILSKKYSRNEDKESKTFSI